MCLCSQHRAPLYCILLAGWKQKGRIKSGEEGTRKKRGRQHTAETAGSSPSSQLPRTGLEFLASASLPWSSWRWARESWRNGEVHVWKKAAKNNIGPYIKKALGDTMLTYTRRQCGKLGPLSPVLKVLKNNCIYKELIFYGALEYWTKKVPSSFQKMAFSVLVARMSRLLQQGWRRSEKQRLSSAV